MPSGAAAASGAHGMGGGLDSLHSRCTHPRSPSLANHGGAWGGSMMPYVAVATYDTEVTRGVEVPPCATTIATGGLRCRCGVAVVVHNDDYSDVD